MNWHPTHTVVFPSPPPWKSHFQHFTQYVCRYHESKKILKEGIVLWYPIYVRAANAMTLEQTLCMWQAFEILHPVSFIAHLHSRNCYGDVHLFHWLVSFLWCNLVQFLLRVSNTHTHTVTSTGCRIKCGSPDQATFFHWFMVQFQSLIVAWTET